MIWALRLFRFLFATTRFWDVQFAPVPEISINVGRSILFGGKNTRLLSLKDMPRRRDHALGLCQCWIKLALHKGDILAFVGLSSWAWVGMLFLCGHNAVIFVNLLSPRVLENIQRRYCRQRYGSASSRSRNWSGLLQFGPGQTTFHRRSAPRFPIQPYFFPDQKLLCSTIWDARYYGCGPTSQNY